MYYKYDFTNVDFIYIYITWFDSVKASKVDKIDARDKFSELWETSKTKIAALFSRIGSLTHRFWALVTWTPKLKVFCIYHCEYEILIPCKLR